MRVTLPFREVTFPVVQVRLMAPTTHVLTLILNRYGYPIISHDVLSQLTGPTPTALIVMRLAGTEACR